MQRTLVRGGIHDLGLEVVLAPGERVPERAVGRDHREDLGGEHAVAHEHLLDALDVQAALAGQGRAAVPHRPVADGADHGDVLGGRRGDVAAQAAGRLVDGVDRHDPVGRVLAARDDDEPGRRVRDDVLPGELGGLVGLTGQQRPKPGIDALDVGLGEFGAQDPVDVAEQVVDVGRGRRRVCLVQGPVGVGGADDPVPTPRDDEEDRLLGAQDDAGRRVDPVPGDDEVHALGRADVELTALADEGLSVVGPHASRIDHLAGEDVELTPGHLVQGPHPSDSLALADEADRGHSGRHLRAVTRCRAGDFHRMPRVVHLRVVVLDGADEGGRLERGGQFEGLAAGEVLVPGQARRVARGSGHRVVEREARLDIGPLDEGLGQRVEEGHWPHEVRGQPGEQQAALLERLGDQPEVEHLQIAQSAVDELAAAAGGARGEVALLDEPGAQPAGHRVEGAARARDPASDDEHVEFLAGGQCLDGGRTIGRGQRGGGTHSSSVPAPCPWAGAGGRTLVTPSRGCG